MAEYNIEDMLGVEVNHIKLGKGVVRNVEAIHIGIEFENDVMKKFQYPDAFEKFLDVEDKQLRAKIDVDLEIRKEESDYQERKRSQSLYNNVKAFDEKRAAKHREKARQQLEKQRQSQMMREQRMNKTNPT